LIKNNFNKNISLLFLNLNFLNIILILNQIFNDKIIKILFVKIVRKINSYQNSMGVACEKIEEEKYEIMRSRKDRKDFRKY